MTREKQTSEYNSYNTYDVPQEEMITMMCFINRELDKYKERDFKYYTIKILIQARK